MKEFLITAVAILLTILTIFCMVKGISIGKFQILSVNEIKENSLALDSKIEEVNNLKNVKYKSDLNNLENSIKNLSKKKQEYLDLASVSSDAEIKKANLEQTYAMEFLWNKVGRYATKEGLNLTWNVVSSGTNNKYNLNFTIKGSYIGIINYIYTLENDPELAFRIENFKISGTGSSSENNGITATFTISNIGIKEETITSATNMTNSSEESIKNNEEQLKKNEEQLKNNKE